MNVLFLNHAESDFGEAFLCAGLVGNGLNVIDYPKKDSYRGIVHRYIRPWHNNEEGVTGPLPWFTPLPDHEETESTLRQKLTDGFFSLVVVGSGRTGALAAFLALQDAIHSASIPVVLHDGEDYDAISHEAVSTVNPDIYLKREWRKGNPFSVTNGKTTLLPFPFSAPDTVVGLPSAEPEYSLIGMFGASWPQRKDLCDALAPLPGAYIAHGDGGDFYKTGVHALVPFAEYITLLRKARFGVSMRGHGWDTCRYWEIAVNTGLLADEVDIHIPHDFTQGYNCLRYRSVPDAVRMAKHIRDDKNHYASDIRLRGVNHAQTYHTNTARVKWLLEAILS